MNLTQRQQRFSSDATLFSENPASQSQQDESRHQALVLFQVEDLIKSTTESETFFSELLSLVASAVGASSGHVWQSDRETLSPMVQSVCQQEAIAELVDQERQIACEVFKSGRASSVALLSNPNGPRGRGRCGLFVPIKNHEGSVAIISLVTYVYNQEQADSQLSLLRSAMDRVHHHYLLKHYEVVSKQYGEMIDARSITEGIGHYIEMRPMAFEVVNRLQKFLGVGRVSLAIRRGEKCAIKAISNQAVFDVRSTIVKRLEHLAAKIATIDQDVWYPDQSEALSPSLRALFDRYIEVAHTLSIGLIPLYAEGKRRDDPNDIAATIQSTEERKKCIGVLIVEGIEAPLDQASIMRGWGQVRDSVSNSINNARTYDGLFLMPVWRGLGTAADWYRGYTRRKALLITAAILIPIMALFVIPAEFKLRGDGVIQPIERQHVFAEAEGTVDQLSVVDGQHVKQGDVLIRLKNPELAERIAEVEGKLREAKSQLETLMVQRVSHSFDNEQEERELVRNAAATEARVQGLTEQVSLLREAYAQLKVKSPISGQVVTWDTRQRLKDRPIHRGERLMTVALPSGPWEVELRIPDKRSGYLLRKWHGRADNEKIETSFVLASNATAVYRGTVIEVAPSSNVDDRENENVVRVRVRLDDDEFEKMKSVKPGTTVIGHVHCGRVSLGYSKLYEFIDWTRRIWFKFIS